MVVYIHPSMANNCEAFQGWKRFVWLDWTAVTMHVCCLYFCQSTTLVQTETTTAGGIAMKFVSLKRGAGRINPGEPNGPLVLFIEHIQQVSSLGLY